MKRIKISMVLTILMSLVGTKTFAYDIEAKNADGQTIYYNYINDGKELEVTYLKIGSVSYNNHDLVIPEEVTYMGRTRKVTAIGDHAFSGSTSVPSVTIPNTVKTVGICAFAGCSYHLRRVVIGDSVESIGRYAFSECRYISDINIPHSVKEIGKNAFEKCTSLVGITIHNVTTIENQLFSGCTNLTRVTLGDGVKYIKEEAFKDCKSLQYINIGKGLIGTSASFSDCKKLKFVNISDLSAWCNIDFYTGECNPLCYASQLYLDDQEIVDLIIPNDVLSIGNYSFYNFSGIKSVVVPNNVNSIGDKTFAGCKNLKSITLGDGLTKIGFMAFSDADIKSVISNIYNPFPISNVCFSKNTYYNASLYVPMGTIDSYKQADGWKNFVYIEEGTPSGVKTLKLDKTSIISNKGQITISGVDNGTDVAVYSASGLLLVAKKVVGNQLLLSTELNKGETAIIKIGEKAVKVIMQ